MNDGEAIVYFIQQGDDGPIKIGFSCQADKRLAELQTSSPQPLHVRALRHGGAREERRLHKLLADDHLRGEWFRPTREVAAQLVLSDIWVDPVFSGLTSRRAQALSIFRKRCP